MSPSSDIDTSSTTLLITTSSALVDNAVEREFFALTGRKPRAATPASDSHAPRSADHGDPPPPPRDGRGGPRRAAGRAEPVQRAEAARHHDRPPPARPRIRRAALRVLPGRNARECEPLRAKAAVRTFFDDSPGSAAAALLDMAETPLSDEEYRRLSALLKRRRDGGQR